MPDFEFFGGIDFSGAREPLSNLWTALGREDEGKLRILSIRPHAYREDLGRYVVGGWYGSSVTRPGTRALWGVDFPLGIPRAASRALGAGNDWESVLDWVADRPADEVRGGAGEAAKSVRAGDPPGAMPPLDLRLYKQTVEGLRWLQQVREAEDVSILPQASLPAARTTLIEVYPSGTAQELGLPRRRAPSRPGEAKARAAALKTFLVFDNEDCEATAINLEDAWDATIACLTAFLCRHDLDQFARAGNTVDRETVIQEGWIYRPPVTVGSTTSPRR